MNELKTLLESIEKGLLLSPEMFAKVDIENVLSCRDQPVFENQWLEAFSALKDKPLSGDQSALVDKIRESAYKATFAATSDPGLSGYVSDDFEIIAKGVVLGLQITFLNSLLEAYLGDKVPKEHSIRSQGDMRAMIALLREKL